MRKEKPYMLCMFMVAGLQFSYNPDICIFARSS